MEPPQENGGREMKTDVESNRYTFHLKQKIMESGADVVGVADAEPLRGLRLDPPDLLAPFSRAISIAVRLPRTVFEQLREGPTPEYVNVYLTANRMLDDIAFRTARLLEDDGFLALPVPASQVLDNREWHGAISHKAVGRMAGVGWQGKSLLLVNPKFGPRIRLVTVLTDAPLEVDGPMRNRCGTCMQCRDACPAQAIKGVSTEDSYDTRDDALHFSRCRDRVVSFSGDPAIGKSICGICIKVCPFGRGRRMSRN